jgi:hypothetical protein
MSEYIDVLFDGPPSHESGRFVEVNDDTGASIRAGEWIERDDGLWALRIMTTPPDAAMSDTASRLAALYAKATQAPWRHDPVGGTGEDYNVKESVDGYGLAQVLYEADAAFIVTLVNAWASGELTPPDPRIPRLQAVVEAADNEYGFSPRMYADLRELMPPDEAERLDEWAHGIKAALDALLPGDTKGEGL